MDPTALREDFVEHLQYSLAKDEYSATTHDALTSLSLTVRDAISSDTKTVRIIVVPSPSDYVYVNAAAADDTGAGTPGDPKKTIGAGITLASGDGRRQTRLARSSGPGA